MRLQTLSKALQRDVDANLGRAARMLGHALPGATLEDLSDFRDVITAASPAEQNYTAGYLRALAEVSAAYEREISKDLAAEMLATGLSPARIELLRELEDGPALGSSLAKQLGKTPSAVSRLMLELRKAGLVEAMAASGDGRQRPQRLTALGHSVCERLPEEPGLNAAGRRALEAAVHAIAAMTQARETKWSVVKDLLSAHLSSPTLERKVKEILQRSSKQFGLLAEERKRVVMLPRLEENLENYLRELMDAGQGLDVLFQEHQWRLPEQANLFVRAAGRDVAAWREIIGKTQPGGLFQSLQVIDSSTEKFSRRIAREELAVVLYDGKATATTDIQTRPEILKLTPYQFCMTAPGQSSPKDLHAINYPAPGGAASAGRTGACLSRGVESDHPP